MSDATVTIKDQSFPTDPTVAEEVENLRTVNRMLESEKSSSAARIEELERLLRDRARELHEAVSRRVHWESVAKERREQVNTKRNELLAAAEVVAKQEEERVAWKELAEKRGRLIERHERRMKRLHRRVLNQRQEGRDMARVLNLYKTCLADQSVLKVMQQARGDSFLERLFG